MARLGEAVAAMGRLASWTWLSLMVVLASVSLFLMRERLGAAAAGWWAILGPLSLAYGALTGLLLWASFARYCLPDVNRAGMRMWLRIAVFCAPGLGILGTALKLRATALGIAHANLENSTSLLPRLGEFMAGLADGLLGMAIAMTIMLTGYVLLEIYSNDDVKENQR